MPVGLDDIIAATRRRVEQAKATADRADLEARAQEHVPRGFRFRLEHVARERTAIIAELKKASPSKGLIRGSYPVGSMAAEFEAAGAAALSVLTEEEFFHGGLTDLTEASAVTGIPCLRKDFIVDEFQMLEARAHRADAVLLIAAALTDPELQRLITSARSFGLDVLCEVHESGEIVRAVEAGCDVIGVNNRDLRTFKVDLHTSLKLAGELPSNMLRVAESGIKTAEDIKKMKDWGYQAFLIGESLMLAEHPAEALKRLIEGSAH